jgi:hypothetical protein
MNTNQVNQKYRLFRRDNGTYYYEDCETGKQFPHVRTWPSGSCCRSPQACCHSEPGERSDGPWFCGAREPERISRSCPRPEIFRPRIFHFRRNGVPRHDAVGSKSESGLFGEGPGSGHQNGHQSIKNRYSLALPIILDCPMISRTMASSNADAEVNPGHWLHSQILFRHSAVTR